MVETLSIIGITLFSLYIIASLAMWGIPTSISETYYLWNNKLPKFSWLFRLVFVVTGFLLIIPMLSLSEGSVWEFTSFIAAAGLIFTGAAADFKHEDKVDKIVHPISAIICAAAAILWEYFIAGTLSYMVISFVLCLILALITRSLKRSYTFWIEIPCFISIFCCIINILFF